MECKRIKSKKNSKDRLYKTKTDISDERQITEEEIDKYCKEKGIDTYFETNEKNRESIHELFKEVIRKLYIQKIIYY